MARFRLWLCPVVCLNDIAAGGKPGWGSWAVTCFDYLFLLLIGCCWLLLCSCKSCPTLVQPHGLYPARLLCLWDSPGEDTGVGCHFLQRIFLTHELNPGLLHCRQILYQLSYDRTPNNSVNRYNHYNNFIDEKLRKRKLRKNFWLYFWFAFCKYH